MSCLFFLCFQQKGRERKPLKNLTEREISTVLMPYVYLY